MKDFTGKKLLVANAIAFTLLAGGVSYAQKVSAARHPNLAAAQRMIEQASQKLSAAQTANEFDMKGHAAKAKKLLDEAYGEIKEAAEAANRK